MFAPNQWETALHCNDASHWLGANLESALINYTSNSDARILKHKNTDKKQRNI